MGYLRDNLKQVSKECQRPDTENIRKLTDGFTSSKAISGISEAVSSTNSKKTLLCTPYNKRFEKSLKKRLLVSEQSFNERI